MNKIFIYITLLFSLISNGVLGFLVYQNYQKGNDEALIRNSIKDWDKFEEKLLISYSDNKRMFLVTDLTKQDIVNFNSELEKLRTELNILELDNSTIEKYVKKTMVRYEKTNKVLKDISIRFQTQEDINKLFKEEVIKGNRLQKIGTISNELNEKEIEEVKSLYYNPNLDNNSKDLWRVTINGFIKMAEKQLQAQYEAEKKIQTVIKDNVVLEGVDENYIQGVKETINNMPQTNKKVELEKQLIQVEEALKNKAVS